MPSPEGDHPLQDRLLKVENRLRNVRLLVVVLAIALMPVLLTIGSIKYKFQYKVGDATIEVEGDQWTDDVKDWINIALPFVAAGIGGKGFLDNWKRKHDGSGNDPQQ